MKGLEGRRSFRGTSEEGKSFVRVEEAGKATMKEGKASVRGIEQGKSLRREVMGK